jgi:hypothetical protein
MNFLWIILNSNSVSRLIWNFWDYVIPNCCLYIVCMLFKIRYKQTGSKSSWYFKSYSYFAGALQNFYIENLKGLKYSGWLFTGLGYEIDKVKGLILWLVGRQTVFEKLHSDWLNWNRDQKKLILISSLYVWHPKGAAVILNWKINFNSI